MSRILLLVSQPLCVLSNALELVGQLKLYHALALFELACQETEQTLNHGYVAAFEQVAYCILEANPTHTPSGASSTSGSGQYRHLFHDQVEAFDLDCGLERPVILPEYICRSSRQRWSATGTLAHHRQQEVNTLLKDKDEMTMSNETDRAETMTGAVRGDEAARGVWT